MDWPNEIINALVLHFDGHAALWTVTGSSSFVILIGLNIEISLFFAINGVIFAKLLPADRSERILGIPNRWALSIGLSLVSVGVELLLHADGVFHWYYWWWNVATLPGDRRLRLPHLLRRRRSGSTTCPVAHGSCGRSAPSCSTVLVAGLVFGPVLGWI